MHASCRACLTCGYRHANVVLWAGIAGAVVPWLAWHALVLGSTHKFKLCIFTFRTVTSVRHNHASVNIATHPTTVGCLAHVTTTMPGMSSYAAVCSSMLRSGGSAPSVMLLEPKERTGLQDPPASHCIAVLLVVGYSCTLHPCSPEIAACPGCILYTSQKACLARACR